jgi:tetratricopeptide (TPR) repeat protein
LRWVKASWHALVKVLLTGDERGGRMLRKIRKSFIESADRVERIHALCAVGLAWMLSAAICAPAVAQSYEAYSRKCYEAGNPNQTIVACSVVITRGLADKQDLNAAFKNRGNAYDDKGQYDLAIADYDKAIAINPNDADAFNDRGATHSAMRKYDLAIKDYDQALRLKPDSAIALNNRCFAKALAGQPEQGLADCNESLRLRPANASTLASRGFAYLKLHRYQAAIADYDAALKISPGDPYWHFGRGMAKLMKGDLRDGDADIVVAEAIMPAIVDEMANLGVQRQSLQ